MKPKRPRAIGRHAQVAIRHLFRTWVEPVLPIGRLWRSLCLYRQYCSDWSRYSALAGSGTLRFVDSYPCLFDRTRTTPFDAHYFYQDIWALRLIAQSRVPGHVDVGSRAIFVGMLTVFTEVSAVDIRPLVANLQALNALEGSILSLPFADNSVGSMSCLHVAEHVGLGRYGDPLDPEGTRKSAQELSRVLAPGGQMYFSLPIGQPRVCFNAHRIHAPEQILSFFADLELVSFACVNDRGEYVEDIDPIRLAHARYSCGLFQFTKRESSEMARMPEK